MSKASRKRKRIENWVRLDIEAGASREDIAEKFSAHTDWLNLDKLFAAGEREKNRSPMDITMIALRAAAERCVHVNARPATSKQIWLLAKLLTEAGEDAQSIGCELSNTSALLTISAASRWIRIYKQEA